LENNFAIDQLNSFRFNLFDEDYKQKIFCFLSKLDEDVLINILEYTNETMLNYFCSKNPAIIKQLKSGRHLSGINKYRYIVNSIINNRLTDFDYDRNHIGVIKALVRHYPEQVSNIFKQLANSEQHDLILFLVKYCEIGIAKQAYTYLNDETRNYVNCDGFAFFSNDIDVNSLNYYQLRANIDYCHDDQILIGALSKLDKSKVVELFEKNVYFDENKAEKMLFNVFSMLEVIKVCETNSRFALNALLITTNQQIIRQFASYDWFWSAFRPYYHVDEDRLCKMLAMLESDILLSNVHVFDMQTFGYIFHYFYQIDSELGYKMFESCKKFKIDIILRYKDLLNNFIGHYGLDYIISLGSDVYERKRLLEGLPLNFAFYMANKLDLNVESEEFRYMHGGRHKALARRINKPVEECLNGNN